MAQTIILSSVEGFSFRGRHSNEFDGLEIISVERPLRAEKRVSEETVPTKDSSYKFEDGYNDNIIPIECRVDIEDEKERRKILRDIASWLNGEGKLIFDDEPDLSYRANSYSLVGLKEGVNHEAFTLAFVCHPFACSEPIQVQRTGISSQTKTLVSNRGTVEHKPLIEIAGTATAIAFTWPTGAFSIANITKKTYIDCDRMIVYTFDDFGKKQNKLMDYTGAFLALQPGTTEISISGTNLNIDVVINTQDAYL